MNSTYSTYEAKARFSEVLRKVRAGQCIRITFHGKEVAEIRPISDLGLDGRLEDLEQSGRLHRHHQIAGSWSPLVQRPGALKRFLEERE